MKYIVLIFTLIASLTIDAAPTCSKNGTRVIYTNGVTTDKKVAKIALGKIQDLSLSASIDLKRTNYDLAYNYEEAIAKDLLEAAVQRFPAGFLKSLGVTNGYAAYMGYLNGGLSAAIYAVALNSIVDKILEIQSDWLINYRSGSLYLQTIREIKGHYETAFNNGERVFAISHSQGGLFMSDAFDQTSFTDKQKYFSGFQIASPLPDEMSSHFGYATHDKDRLINFVRGTIGALPANVSAPLIVNNAYEGISDYAIDFVINHGIVTTYLNDLTIKSQVIPKLIETAQLLESNCPIAVINYTKSNLQVNFDSTDPQDPNVTGLTYSWSFGDNKTENTISKTLSHNYSVAGSYNVILTVTDSYGASETVSASVVIESKMLFGFVIDYTKSYIKTLVLVSENGFPYSRPANFMFSTSITGIVTAGVGDSITFGRGYYSSGLALNEINCGSWIKTSDIYGTFTCTRGETSPESTTIIRRSSFISSLYNGEYNKDFYSMNSARGTTYGQYPIVLNYNMIDNIGTIPMINIPPITYPTLFLF